MNYRHAFHAGNAADVVKHAILCLLVQRLCAKPAPFAVLDTHAGIGRYDLAGEAARRTGEATAGIQRLLAMPDLPDGLQPYVTAVTAFNHACGGVAGETLRWYPGSPCLVAGALRDQDRLICAELHPQDVESLRIALGRDRRVAVHRMDGWQALKAHLPFREKRGLVLIDPPFEAADEYDRLVAGLRLAHGRFATGLYALWYPVKDRADIWRLHQGLEDSGIRRILAVELTWQDDGRVDRLNGCGLILVNPPWQLDEALADLLPALHGILGASGGGTKLEWIVPE